MTDGYGLGQLTRNRIGERFCGSELLTAQTVIHE